MPRLRRMPLARREYSDQHRDGLQSGHFYFVKLTTEQKREAWRELRSEILPQWIDENPGSRPWAWWMFEAIERRRCTSGVHPFDNPERQAWIAKWAHVERVIPYNENSLSFGVPHCYMVEADWHAEYESEAEYLDRLNLLTPSERVALAKDENESETDNGTD